MHVKKTGSAGYTLIETAIVLSIIGLFLASGASAYKLYMQNKAIDSTINNANLVVNAVSNFLIQHGRYPCPARLNAQRTDADYGMETQCDSTNAAYPVLAAGNCAGGICKEESNLAGAPLVRRGAVPFRVLGIPESFAEDGYHMRIQYAVTESLAVAETYTKNGGAISIVDEKTPTPRSVIEPPNTAHYVIFSSGPTKEGGYTRDGVMHMPCGIGFDAENCNTSAANIKAVYRFTKHSATADAGRFDDLVKFYTSIDTPLWRVADTNGFHIRDLIEAELPGGGKIGVANTAPAATVDINGNVKTSGTLYMGLLQEGDNSAAFPPEKIAKNVPEMDCADPAHPNYDAAKPYVLKIENGKTVCGPMPNIGCPSGQKMTGIQGDGSIVCSSFLGCNAGNVSVCWDIPTSTWDVRPLPFGVANQTVFTAVSGTSRIDTYRCTSGSWSYQGTTGVCTCAAPVTTSVACTALMGSGGWTGTGSTTSTQNCTTGAVTTTTDSSACQCGPRLPQTATPTCESIYGFGFTGTYVTSSDWVCDTTTTGHWTPGVVITDTCACTPQTVTVAGTCPDPIAFTGSYNKKRDFVCPGATWGTPYDYPGGNTCVCVPGTTKTTTTGCPPGDVGSITYLYTYDCPTNSWSLTNTSNTCSPVTYKWKSTAVPTMSTTVGGTFELGSVCTLLNQTGTCYSYGSGSTIYNYPSCTCQ